MSDKDEKQVVVDLAIWAFINNARTVAKMTDNELLDNLDDIMKVGTIIRDRITILYNNTEALLKMERKRNADN